MRFNFMPYLYMDKDEGAGSGAGSTTTEGGTATATQTTTAIDWTKVKPEDIPSDLLKKNKLYADVLDESIDRRQKIKALNGDVAKLQTQLGELGGEESNGANSTTVTKPAVSGQNAEAGSPDVQKLIEAALKPIQDKFTQMQSESLAGWQDQAGKATGIKSKAILSALKGSTAEEVLKAAKTIAQEQGITPPDSSYGVGNPTGERSKTSLNRAKDIMIGKTDTQAYDKSVHQGLGGGVFNPYED